MASERHATLDFDQYHQVSKINTAIIVNISGRALGAFFPCGK